MNDEAPIDAGGCSRWLVLGANDAEPSRSTHHCIFLSGTSYQITRPAVLSSDHHELLVRVVFNFEIRIFDQCSFRSFVRIDAVIFAKCVSTMGAARRISEFGRATIADAVFKSR